MSYTYQKKYHYIYITTRFDGMFYVGMHSTDNLEDGYMGSGTRIARSLKYHGRDKHTFEIVEHYPTRAALVEAEKHLVDSELLLHPLCLNLSVGGNGTSHNESTAVRISNALSGRILAESHKANIGVGVKKSGKDVAHWRGKNLSEEHKAAIAKGSTGRKDSDEVRAKKSAASKGKPKSAEHVANNAKAQSKSYLLEREDGTSEIIANLNAWCRDHKVNQPGLRVQSSQDKYYNGVRLKQLNGELIACLRRKRHVDQ